MTDSQVKGDLSAPFTKISAKGEGKNFTNAEKICYLTMKYLLSQEGKIKDQQEIADHMGVTRQRISALIKSLADKDGIRVIRYLDPDRKTKGEKGNFLSYDLKLPTKVSYNGKAHTPNPDKPKKIYTCNVCGEQIKNIVNHFRNAHPNFKNSVTQKIKEMQSLTGEFNNETSKRFFRKLAMAVPDNIYREIISEFKDVLKSNYDIRNKGALFVKMSQERSQIAKVII